MQSIQIEDQIVAVSPYDMSLYDEKLSHYYTQITSGREDTLKLALDFFLGQPYLFEALGEGKHSHYSEEPLYRTDKFDCVTYVDTVLSLYKSKTLSAFKTNILKIRYRHDIEYQYRTDWFTDLEWIPHVKSLGWIHDIMPQITDERGKSILQIASTVIDKPNWYRVRPFKAMHLLSIPSLEEAVALRQKLRAQEKYYSATPSTLSYLPLSQLYNHEGKAIEYLFDQISTPAMIAIVRPDWPIREALPGFPQGYGTNLNVSHVGIAIRTAEGLMFYNASSLQQKVIAEPLSDYLKKYLHHPTIKGIHVEQIL